MMLSKSGASGSRPSTRTLNWYICPSGAGAWPSAPAATCTFCSRSALVTSPAVICRAVVPAPGVVLPRREPQRIQPQPHRVLALAEDRHVGDARHALERILHVD